MKTFDEFKQLNENKNSDFEDVLNDYKIKFKKTVIHDKDEPNNPLFDVFKYKFDIGTVIQNGHTFELLDKNNKRILFEPNSYSTIVAKIVLLNNEKNAK